MPENSGIELAQENDVAHCTADSSMGMSEEENLSSEAGTDESSDDDNDSHPSLASVLSVWAIKYGVSLVALSALLSRFSIPASQRMVVLC